MTDIIHSERAHARLGPSGADRWATCPGAPAMEAPFPNTSSPFAEWGTRCHEIAESTLLSSGAPIALTHTPGDEEDRLEKADVAQTYVDYVLGIVKETGGELLVEARLDISPWVPDCFGTADAVILDYAGKTIHVADLKGGSGVPVSVEDNRQLKLYGLGAYNDYGWMGDFERVMLHIVQPRTGNYGESWEIGVDDLLAFGEEMRAAAQRTRDPDAPLVPSEKGCRFCKAAAVCPELARQNLAAAEALFDDAPPLPANITQPDLPAPQQLTREQVAAILSHSGRITNWLKAIEAHAQAALEAGEELPGYKLVRGRSNRRWIDERQAQQVILKTLYEMTDSTSEARELAIQPAKLRTPAQVEKVLGKQKAILEELTEKPEGRVTIARESDKRVAIDPAALDGSQFFEPVE
ncbi:uncharacterized protein DUF2800 [Modicisalibacter xianhensis]|uniref:Uncharacterized protein DUF2800 n=1 Tax=Modicisalibacter xianhensis TaxID=442341 RepID=A0A4R8F8B3_9GAMM|nr:DUF2800 domain-containing protein [Halomonas xianhensis]TDX21649.1 uncharacterized protein DUF2800 [Halomonas xianhensis]